MVNKKASAQTVVIKIRNNKFETVTRRLKLKKPTRNPIEFFQSAKVLFEPLAYFLKDGIRLLGLTVTDLSDTQFEEVKLDLFETK